MLDCSSVASSKLLSLNAHSIVRQDIVDRFNTDPSVFVMLLSTRAGGLGETLCLVVCAALFNVH